MKRIFIATLVLVLTGCSTPYQPFSTFSRGGYAEKRISLDTFQVDYYANFATSKETHNTLLQYRSAVLTVRNNFKYYTVIKAQRRVPNSIYGGFKITKQIIKMYMEKPDTSNTEIFEAKEVINQYKDTIGDSNY